MLLQSCPTLCDSVDCSPPGSSVHGILQARVPRGLPFPPPGVLTEPGIEPTSLMCLAVADRFFTTSTIWGDNVFSTKNNSIFWFLNYYLNYHLSLPFLAASYLLFLKISSFSLKVLFSIIMEGRGCSFTSKSKKKNKMYSVDITKREAVRQHPELDKATKSNYQNIRTEEHIKWYH